MHSVIVKWSQVNIQTKTDILQKLTDVFVCVSPSLNHCLSPKCNQMDCTGEVLGGPHASASSHGRCIPKGTDRGVVDKPLPGQSVMPYFEKDP